MKNRTDFRKTVETGVDPRLHFFSFLFYYGKKSVSKRPLRLLK